ncbi:MAG: hypothetical protein VB091_13865 [Christensenella sp.]|nr:hypothetical protein [Christensenella sp.]
MEKSFPAAILPEGSVISGVGVGIGVIIGVGEGRPHDSKSVPPDNENSAARIAMEKHTIFITLFSVFN